MGVIAVRNESVRLSLDDQFSTGMARAAAATALLSKELHNLDGSNASLGGGLKDAAKEAEGLGKSTEGLGKSSDRASTSVTRLASTLNKQTGAVTLSTRAMVAKTLADRGALDAAQKLGVSVKDVTDAALGSHDALTRMNGSLSATRVRLEETGASTARFDTDAQKLVGSVSRMSTEMSTAQKRATLLASAVGTLGPKTDDSGKSIDKFSVRLGLLADAAIIAGPALLPLGASTIPLLTGAIAGLGAAAGGIGVAVLAFHGLGAAMKALDAYNLDPTIENLKKLQAEEKKIGPAGAQFVQFIDDLEPKLQALQTTARQRMFPGLEDGITSLLTRLPEVRAVVAHLADGLGQLAREAGASLSGPAWTPFFEYLRTTAEPTLLEFGHATGDVALGLSRLLVAFAPLSGGFTAGIERAAKAFADWSAHLDTNQSFQRFLAYVQESGPKVLALLGSLAGTFASVAQAAAPLGQDILPVLTQLVHLLGLVAASPFGSAFVTGLVALRAYVRAAQLATLATTAFGNASESAGANLDTMGGKARFAVTALIGLEVAGQVLDGIAKAAAGAAPNVEKLAAALISADQAQVNSSLGVNLKDTLASLDPGGIDGVATSLENLGEKGGEAGKALAVGFGGFVGLQPKMMQADIATKKATQTFQSLDAALTEIATTGGPEKAQAAFKALADAQGLSASQQKAVMSHLPQFSAALQRSANTAKLTAVSLHQVSAAAEAAKQDVVQLSAALAGLSGWFDKREAMREYKKSLDDLTKSLKNGFQPKDVEKIDAVGRSMLQVANSIKDPQLQRDFLAHARASLEKIASDAGPKGKAAIDKVIAAMDRLGATAPKVKIDADDRRAKNAITNTQRGLSDLDRTRANPSITAEGGPVATRTINGVQGLMDSLSHKKANPHISVDPGNSFSILGTIKSEINSLHDKTVTIRTVHAGGFGPQPAADGATVPKSGLPYADRYLYMLADGEEIISNRRGQADHFRADRAAGRIPGYADGGTTGFPKSPDLVNTYPTTDQAALAYEAAATHEVTHDAIVLAASLKDLKKQVDASKEAFDKEKQAVTDLRSTMADFASQVAGKFTVDLSGSPSSGVDLSGVKGLDPSVAYQIAQTAQGDPIANQIAAEATAGAQAGQMPGIIAALKAAGVTGQALVQILTQESFANLLQLAANPGQAQALAAGITSTAGLAASAGQAASSTVYGASLHDTVREFRQLRAEMRTYRSEEAAAEKVAKAQREQIRKAAAVDGPAQTAADLNNRGAAAKARAHAGG